MCCSTTLQCTALSTDAQSYSFCVHLLALGWVLCPKWHCFGETWVSRNSETTVFDKIKNLKKNTLFCKNLRVGQKSRKPKLLCIVSALFEFQTSVCIFIHSSGVGIFQVGERGASFSVLLVLDGLNWNRKWFLILLRAGFIFSLLCPMPYCHCTCSVQIHYLPRGGKDSFLCWTVHCP